MLAVDTDPACCVRAHASAGYIQGIGHDLDDIVFPSQVRVSAQHQQSHASPFHRRDTGAR